MRLMIVRFVTLAAALCAVSACGSSSGGGGGADAGSTDTAKTSGGTCGYQVCADMGKNCCPYMACMNPCALQCSTTFSSCAMGCMADMACQTKCQTDMAGCVDGCMTSCKVTGACKSAFDTFSACQEQADQASCGAMADDKKMTCEVDACCNEAKAAF